MKHKVDNFNSYDGEELNPIILEILDSLRKGRDFNVENYVDEKLHLLNNYFGEYGIDTAVISVSGGLDSAVVYALLMKLKNEKNSNLKDVYSLTLPYSKSKGMINQSSTISRSADLVGKFGGTLLHIDLSKPLNSLMKEVKSELITSGSNWSEGQLVSYLRTPTYYYVTALLNDIGKRAVVVGTTNKDEGAYLGYFGKASDGLVDIQLISDIHKSEVYELASYLDVPKSILNAIPTGDMYDGRVDEEVFGAPYDFVELFLLMKELDIDTYKSILEIISSYPLAYSQFEKFNENLEKLHSYNKHKYLGASPAVHMDVIPYFIEHGWKYYNYAVQ